MKAIIISEKDLDRLFEAALTKLKAERFSSIDPTAKFENSPLGSMHRAFHYEVCRLKDDIKAEGL